MGEDGWRKAAPETDVKEGEPIAVEVDGDDVLLVRVDGEIHACAGKCTHYGGPLADGLLDGHVVTCPWHNARFDVTDGRMVSPPALDHLTCYEAKVEAGDVYVRPRAEAREEPEPVAGTEGLQAVIVGAGAAGNAAAETLRREGFGGKIALITAEPDRPYDRPNLSKEYLSGEAKPEWIPLRDESFYADRGIDLLTSHEVAAVDPGAGSVTFADGSELAYDRLLLATGGVPRPLPVEGGDLEGVFLLRTLADAESIIGALDGAENVVVIGAGFIGMEVAGSLAERGLKVDLVARAAVPMARVFGEAVGRWLRGLHEEAGTTFHMGASVAKIGGAGKVESVELDDGSTLPADVVVAGLGIAPAVDFLEGTGLVEDGAVPVDERLQTKAENVYAAGDIAMVPDARLGRRIRVEHWVVAERQGQHAARMMLGRDDPYDEVPFFWTQQHGKSINYAGSARTFDRIAVRGEIGGEFLTGYYEAGALRAVASLWRDVDFIAAMQVLKAGRNIDPEQFEDEGVDLRELAG
ncbi:MAG: FAD-dependent oxidoreductase [Planctomycetota bacterium]